MTIGERLGHGVQEAVDRFGDVLLGEARSLGDLVHDIGLRHHSLLGPPARDVRDSRVPEAGRAVPYPQVPTLSIASWTRGYLDSAVRSAARRTPRARPIGPALRYATAPRPGGARGRRAPNPILLLTAAGHGHRAPVGLLLQRHPLALERVSRLLGLVDPGLERLAVGLPVVDGVRVAGGRLRARGARTRLGRLHPTPDVRHRLAAD